MSKSPHTRIHPLSIAVFVAVCTFALAACGSSGSSESGSPPPNYAKKLAGSPAPLAALHKQENQVLEGGKVAFDARIEELRGFPKVVNVWGSWCGPCRAEFPHFQQAAASLGKKVAFLGVDSQDETAKAEDFLAANPVPYPSYSDMDQEIGRSIGVPGGIPATAFFNDAGERTFTKFGDYSSKEELEADVQTYAIDGETG